MLKIGIFRTHQCPDHIEGPFMRGDTNEEAQKILISTLKKGKNRQRRGISTFPKNFSNFPSWNRGGKPFLNKFSTGKGEDRGGETLHIFSALPPLWALLAKTEPPGRKMAVKLSRRPHTLFFLYFCQNSFLSRIRKRE